MRPELPLAVVVGAIIVLSVAAAVFGGNVAAVTGLAVPAILVAVLIGLMIGFASALQSAGV